MPALPSARWSWESGAKVTVGQAQGIGHVREPGLTCPAPVAAGELAGISSGVHRQHGEAETDFAFLFAAEEVVADRHGHCSGCGPASC